MWEYIKNKWHTERRIKIIVVIVILLLMGSMVLTSVIGLNPNNHGTVISGDRTVQKTLNANESIIIAFNTTQTRWVVGYSATEQVSYLISNQRTELSNGSINFIGLEYGASKKKTISGEEIGEFWFLLINNANSSVKYVYEIREYTPVEYNGGVTYSLGTFIRNYTIYGALIYFAIAILLPWFRQRKHPQNYQQIPTEQRTQPARSQFCSNCGKSVSTKFCQNCGQQVRP